MQSEFAKFEFNNPPQAIEGELHKVKHLHSQLKIDQSNQSQSDLRRHNPDELFQIIESVITFPQRRLIKDQGGDPNEVNEFLYQIKTQGTDETQARKVKGYECCGQRWKTAVAIGGHRAKIHCFLRKKIRRRNEF